MKVLVCDGCGEPEEYPYRQLSGVQINTGKSERVYCLCDVCRSKIVRLIEGNAL